MQSPHEESAGYVLVADDDPLTLRSVCIILRGAGLRVVPVRDSAAALEQIRREKPRVACLDVMMGPINGLDLCRLIKSEAELRDIHVLLLTARAMEREREEGLAAGADDYVAKPFSNKDLVARVRRGFGAASRKA
jgi:DNA-binding response OmpR family regulator